MKNESGSVFYSPLYVRVSEYLFHAGKRTVFTSIAKAVIDKIEDFPHVNIEELASYCNTTPSSITKFVREIGYGSFQELKNDTAPYRLTHQGIKGMSEKDILEEIYNYIPCEECLEMARIINNSRSIVILSNSFLFNIANVMRESISGRIRKVYLVERSNDELIRYLLKQVDCVFILTLTGQWVNSCQYIHNIPEKTNICLISGGIPAVLDGRVNQSIELNVYPQMLYANYFSHKYLESIVFNIVQHVI
ncbi:transcriptional regulator, RpiR family protein [Salmonella enterica]|nr:transcriptional regulator, RpiR family protein [Salmonella enterica subsp. enterica serovar Everleigh]EBV2191024.1 transcriptional regulator, RpiR family protein [Salmonella enterica subsp. enterica serovar Afula]ECD5048434.1 transcriptional regulator, RpiR family protein [Salmonella enterica subsp. enterica serovar Everleigh]EIY6649012.1 transcriptional regulator, RpiR family protein [Salmonella enterica]EJX6612294.1 transcriptional regulator, RpiR family protein [Salmonella enterica]